jgi:DNA-binding transcriptional ArsR family regulator
MDTFYVLAEPRRRKILELLAINGQLTSGEISKKFNITAQAISQHLNVLLEAKVVLMKKKAQKHIYFINTSKVVEVEEWAKKIETQWNSRLDNLEKLLQKENTK